MNAEHLEKGGELTHKLWACLAAAQCCAFLLNPTQFQNASLATLSVVILGIALLCTGGAALVYYIFACEYYARARGVKNVANMAMLACIIFLVSLILLTVAFGACWTACQGGWNPAFTTALQLIPLLSFVLGILPIRILTDRCTEPAS
ncbi:MAG: hypothetical protein H7Z41_01700 [Cytophagales bacterium]|nr:hypothetical protein [Armatimonadota bacterium]